MCSILEIYRQIMEGTCNNGLPEPTVIQTGLLKFLVRQKDPGINEQ